MLNTFFMDIKFYKEHIEKLRSVMGEAHWPSTRANKIWEQIKHLPNEAFATMFSKTLNSRHIDPSGALIDELIQSALNPHKASPNELCDCKGAGLVWGREKNHPYGLYVWKCHCSYGAAFKQNYTMFYQALKSEYDIL